MFRNETSKVMTKAKVGTVNENSKPVACTSRVGHIRDRVVPDLVTNFSVAPAPTIERTTVAPRNLSVPLEYEATCYFFHNFVCDDPSSRYCMNAYAQVMPTLYQQDSSFGVLPKIVDAIGLAGISNINHSPKLMIAAGRKYAGVLRAINASIQDSTKATTDQTLIAIMLLGLFEVLHHLEDWLLLSPLTAAQTVTCSDPESMRSWVNHVQGATAIARLRGTDQLRTATGRMIFVSLRTQIVSH